jgi:hypothetical protein
MNTASYSVQQVAQDWCMDFQVTGPTTVTYMIQDFKNLS